MLVCGDRKWTDPGPIRNRLRLLTRTTVLVHGAQRGADRLAAHVALLLGWDPDHIEAFPAAWDDHGIAAGPIRNQQMLDSGPIDLVLAFHDRISESKGTADMIHRAKRAGIPIEVISHTGTEHIHQPRLALYD